MIRAIAFAAGLYLALNLVRDPEPPQLVFIADLPMQCPIKNACDPERPAP
jgi:hypothetical protein